MNAHGRAHEEAHKETPQGAPNDTRLATLINPRTGRGVIAIIEEDRNNRVDIDVVDVASIEDRREVDNDDHRLKAIDAEKTFMSSVGKASTLDNVIRIG